MPQIRAGCANLANDDDHGGKVPVTWDGGLIVTTQSTVPTGAAATLLCDDWSDFDRPSRVPFQVVTLTTSGFSYPHFELSFQ